MTRVLVIEEDPDSAECVRQILETDWFAVTVASSGSGGIVAARQDTFAAIVLGLRPDADGLDVLRTLRVTQPQAHIVVVSGHLTVRATVDAIRIGANDVLEKPVSADSLVAAIAEIRPATSASARPGNLSGNHSVAHRWARHVLKGCRSTDDLKTLDAWARRAGTSTTMICESCRILDMKPHDARDLTRALYAMFRSAQLRCPPAVVLDVADSRTLRTFQRRAGAYFRATSDMDAIDRFLDTQSFVDPRSQGMKVLRQLLGKLLSEGITG